MIEELEIILETTSKILQKHVNHSLRQNIVSENTDILNLWNEIEKNGLPKISCLLYTSPSPRDTEVSRMPSSA